MTGGDDPTSDLARIFSEEATEHLDGMVDCLLAAEAGHAPGEATDALFRHAHSIKGNAGMLGFEEAGAIASAIEDVLQRARESDALSPVLTEPLLQATEALRHAVAGEHGVAAAAVERLARRTNGGPRMPAHAPADAALAFTDVPQAPSDGPRIPSDGVGAAGEAAKPEPETRSIRVAAHKVDRLLDAVGETVLHNRRLEHAVFDRSLHVESDLEREMSRGKRLLDELQGAVLELRTVPLSSITNQLPRAVHDIAVAEGKEVDLQITGADTHFDRVLLDGMSDVLGHLLRNAIAHGIEPPDARERAGKPRRGRVDLSAEPRRGQVEIKLRDDGQGVVPEVLAEATRRGVSLVDVLAQAGFSTANGVSEIAGRGVGLDAVKRQVESVGGSLAIDTEQGVGTETTLLLPVSLALQRVLIVQRGDQRFGLPLTSVTEAVPVERMMMLEGRPSIQVREECLRLYDLALVLGMATSELPDAHRALVVDATNVRLAIACDRLIGEEEVVVKPLDASLAVEGYLGSAIMSDGAVMLILDPAHLVRAAPRASSAVRVDAKDAPRKSEAPKVLVVDDQFTVRELQRRILRAAGYRVEVAGNGREALEELRARGDFDMVLTDLQMPEMDGLALLAAIRADTSRSSLPVVVVTSRASDEDRKRGADAGADAYIVKDEFDQEALLETVQRLVRVQ